METENKTYRFVVAWYYRNREYKTIQHSHMNRSAPNEREARLKILEKYVETDRRLVSIILQKRDTTNVND